MIRTESQNNFTLNEQIYAGDIMVMSLTANIDIQNPQSISYSPAIIDTNEYLNNRAEMHERMSNFEERIYLHQQEILSKIGTDGLEEMGNL